jgi:hypothetical protein
MTARPLLGGRPLGVGPLAALPLLVFLVVVLMTVPRSGGAAETPRGASRRVLLVTTDPAGEIAPVVVARLRGELRAARFEMDVATIASDAPRRTTVEEMAARGGVTAALGIFVGADRVEMWAADASAGRTLMQNLPLDPGATDRRATIVAVKAVDLLKATLAEIWSAPPPLSAVVADQPSAPPPATADAVVVAPPTATAVDAAPERTQDRFDVTGGGGWLQQGTHGGWAPLLAIAAALGRGPFAARVTVSALGQTITFSQAEGSAQLAQEIALCELMLRSGAWHGLRGALSLGAGAHHLSITGRGQPGFRGDNFDLWSMATAAGAGVSLDVSPHWVLALDARVVEDLPATEVQIFGQSAVRVGRPTVWLALAAGVRFQ